MSNTLKSFNKNGFALGDRVLSNKECDELGKEIEHLIKIRKKLPKNKRPVSLSSLGGLENPIWQIVDIFMASEKFTKLVHSPKITGTVAKLSKAKELRLWHDQVQYKPKQTGGQNWWHQDWPYWGILDRPNQVTAWIALDDADEENGCMSMVKGSHKWGNQIAYLHSLQDGDHSFFEIPDEFKEGKIKQSLCPVPKGHVHFHHGLTWHGSHMNTSGRPRRAIALHFMTEDTRYNRHGNHLMKKYVDGIHGHKIEGDAFPLVYANGKSIAYRKKK